MQSVLLRVRPALPNPDEVSAARGPLMMEAVLSSLHSLKGSEGEITLEIGMYEGKIALFIRAQKSAAALIESQLYAQYPDCEIDALPTTAFDLKDGEVAVTHELTLSNSELFPIKRHPQYVDLVTRQAVDTLAGITSTLVRYPLPSMRASVQIVLKPLTHSYRKRALRLLPLLEKGISRHHERYARFFTKVHLARGWRRIAYFPLDILMGGFRTWFIKMPSIATDVPAVDDDPEKHVSVRSHDREDRLAAAVDKLNRLLFEATVRTCVVGAKNSEPQCREKLRELSASFQQFSLPQCNGFESGRVQVTTLLPRGLSEKSILSAEEVATLWHVPNMLVKTPNIDWVMSKKLEPPTNLPLAGEEEKDVTVLGEAVFRGHRTPFGIRIDDRRRHLYTVGKTGMGKSTILMNMIAADIEAGRGVALIDPHGDLVESVLRLIPRSRMNDVILFDPSDKDHPIAFNMLQCKDPEQRPLVVSGLMSVFKKLWPEAFSGRMEYILRNTLLALTEAENQTMLGIMRMFSDSAFRAKIVSSVNDHLVKSFWLDEFTSWSEKYQTEALAAIQNKIGQLLSTPLIRNIVGQVSSTVDFRHAMDTKKIILMNLSKGRLGEDNSAFLGSMFVTKFQLDAMSRADIPEAERLDFCLFVDEFQNFATESFATILSEARKYRLNLTIAHQYVNQLLTADGSTSLRDAVFGNVGSMVIFQVGSDDAEPLSIQLEEMVETKDILSLPKYHAYVRLMIGGVPSKPFSVTTLPAPEPSVPEERVEAIKKLSRERYTEPRTSVEEKISRWVAGARESAAAAKTQLKAKEKDDEERKKAKAKKMTLEEYRAWRDREMWTNDFNAIRKREMKGEKISEDDQKKKKDLEKKLKESGGVPEISKTMISDVEKAKKKKAA